MSPSICLYVQIKAYSLWRQIRLNYNNDIYEMRRVYIEKRGEKLISRTKCRASWYYQKRKNYDKNRKTCYELSKNSTKEGRQQ